MTQKCENCGREISDDYHYYFSGKCITCGKQYCIVCSVGDSFCSLGCQRKHEEAQAVEKYPHAVEVLSSLADALRLRYGDMDEIRIEINGLGLAVYPRSDLYDPLVELMDWA